MMHSTLTYFLRGACLALGAALLTACATGPQADPRDPLEPLNRAISTANNAIDKAVLSPVARGYRTLTPAPLQSAVGNFFNNIQEVWSIPNSLLQGKVKDAIESTMRVSFNTVFGFAGLLDIATELRMQRHSEDFGQTLGVWGVPSGPYLVWPLLGPSTLRDSVGRAAAMAAGVQNEIVQATVATEKANRVQNALTVTNLVHTRAELLPATDLAEKVALDLYSFTKDAYLQSRESAVHDQKPSPSQPPSASEGVSEPSSSLATSNASASPKLPEENTPSMPSATSANTEEDWTRGLEPDPPSEPAPEFVIDPVSPNTVIQAQP